VSPSTAKARWAVGVAIVATIAAIAIVWSRRPASFTLERDADQNIVLVTIDTLRADALGSYGGRAATPNLDRLASNGARFTFAHAHAVVTLPSHTSILTGLLPYEHGMRDNSGYRVREGTETLATRLKPLGFATGAFVGGFPLTKRFGLTPGFDVYDDQIPEMRGDITFTMPERRADAVVSRAVDWIGKQEAKFFAWVHVFDPHLPYKPPDEFASRYSAQPYDGEVAWTDHALGPLLERLSTARRRTTVIVTSDHGESLGEHGEMTHGMFAYEATLRVPLIVATIDPRVATRAAGVVIDSPVRHVDIAPTVMETIGATSDTDLSGSSLVDVIRNGRGDNRPTYFESMTYNLVRGWAPLRGVLAGRQKFVDQPIVELYDLSSDPREEQNVAPQEPERLRVMVNTLRSFNVAPPNLPAQESSEATAALRSLGYVSGTAPQRKVYTEADDLKNLVTIDRDLHRASELFQNGNVPDAIALFESVIDRRSDTADAYISLAHAYWETARPDVAVATLERALKNGAPDRDVRIRLALYLSESGIDAARAIALLETMPPTDVEALNGLGVAYGGARRYPDAIRAFNRVLALDPTNALALQNIASMVLRQALEGRDKGPKLREAETFARQAIDADPALAKAYTTLGVVLAETGRKPEAIDSWKTAVELDGREFDALYNLTVLLSEAGRIDDARTYARQFVDTAPPALYQPAIEQLRAFIGR
jgi:arylsulfatase A-like enzyme/cytochrome c-type biogenesis protein CcmH/NrfG